MKKHKSKTAREFFIDTINDEIPRFERVFKALPVEKLSHTHHPKSKTAEALIVQMADEAESFMEFLVKRDVDWSKKSKIEPNPVEIAKRFASSLEAAAHQVAKMTEEIWQREVHALYEGKVVWKTERGTMAWGLLLDLIHHRGQLSTYIRPMGGKVPSIYGPSGDTPDGQ